MNFLFHIHSNINLLTATLVVENTGIDKSKVVFLLNRNVSTDFDVKTIELPEKVYYHQFNKLKRLLTFEFLKNKKTLSIIDGIINEHVNHSFSYFCPNARYPLYRAFISNPKCVEVNYIEDGMDGYLSKTEFSKKFKNPIPIHLKFADALFNILPFFCGDRLNYVGDSFMPNLKEKKSTIYCLSKTAYTNQENKNRIVLSSKTRGHYSDINLNSTNIFVFDAVKNQKVVPEEIFYKFVSWFCKDYFKEKRMGIKFHPFQDAMEKERILEIFGRNKIEVEIISDDIVLEAAFLNNEKLTVFGIGSSLLVYAALFGVEKVHVLYPFFEYNTDFKSPRLSTWNDVFLERNDVYIPDKNFFMAN
ncbi:MAG: polysialyltransferase family glycosyltransferase [Allomuricauda sp.]